MEKKKREASYDKTKMKIEIYLAKIEKQKNEKAKPDKEKKE